MIDLHAVLLKFLKVFATCISGETEWGKNTPPKISSSIHHFSCSSHNGIKSSMYRPVVLTAQGREAGWAGTANDIQNVYGKQRNSMIIQCRLFAQLILFTLDCSHFILSPNRHRYKKHIIKEHLSKIKITLWRKCKGLRLTCYHVNTLGSGKHKLVLPRGKKSVIMLCYSYFEVPTGLLI